MAVQLDARTVSADSRADEYRPSDWEQPRAVPRGSEERPEPEPSPSVTAEYRIDEVGQRSRADAAAVDGEVPEGQAADAPAAASPEAPAADAANPPAAADDLSRLGAAYNQNNRPAQMLWNEHSANVVTGAGREQNGLSEAQAQQNADLARALMTAQTPDGATASVQQLAAADTAMLLRATGIEYERQDPNQLLAATRYINEAPDAGNQQERIRKTLDGFHILGNIGHPQLSSQEMKDLLWGAASVPGHAFGSMNQSEVAAKYQGVVGALNGPAGDYKIRIGKHDLKFTLDEAGGVTETSTKKPSVWGKILKGVLTVASFIPIPVIAIPARIASAAISAIEGIKNGNWLQAVAGVAGGVAAGAGAIAGKATAGVAATTAKVATNVANAARGVQATWNAAQTGSLSGIVSAGLQAGADAAGAFANGADRVANVARDVQTWANRALVGNEVAVNLKNGNILDAVSGGAALTASVAGDFKNDDGSLKPMAEQVQRYAGYAADGANIAGNVQRGNYAAALSTGSNLAGRLHAQFAAPDPSRTTAADPAKDQTPSPNGAVAQYLDYAASAVGIGQNLHRGNYETALVQAGTLTDNIADDHRQVRDGQPGTISQWLNYGANAVNIGSNLVKHNFERVLDRTSLFLAQIDRNRDGANTGTEGANPPSLLQRFSEWTGWGASAHQVVNKVRGGQYESAVVQGFNLGTGIAADLLRPDEAPTQHDGKWADIQKKGGRIISAGVDVGRAILGGDMLAISQAAERFTGAVRETFSRPLLPSRPLPGGLVASMMPALESRSVAGEIGSDPIATRTFAPVADLPPAIASRPVTGLSADGRNTAPIGDQQASLVSRPGTAGTNNVELTGGSPQGLPGNPAFAAHTSTQVDDARLSAEKTELLLDLGQIALDIIGIFEPTPFADITNGVTSLLRGNPWDALISGVGVLPYLGDVAKLGKLPKFARIVERATDIARLDPGFADQVRPALKKIRGALDALPVDSLPGPARDAIQSMKTRLDEFFSGTVNAAQALTRTSARVGQNNVTWTLDAQGRPLRAEATLHEVFSNAPRGADEVRAQSQAAGRGLDGDAGGHIIGHRFTLDQGSKNLFPQNAQFNNSAYRTMENEWADWIASGKEVRVDVALGPSGANRPGRMDVSYRVVDPATGETVYRNSVRFQNEAGQTFDRVPSAEMSRQ